MPPASPPERWFSTHQAARIMGLHAQTVRDRCDRGELIGKKDPSGRRLIAGSQLEALGYVLPPASQQPARRRPSDFQASLTAQLAGALSDDAIGRICEGLADSLEQHDAGLIAATERLLATQAALRELASARFWKRSRVIARLRASGVLSDSS